MMMNRNIDTQRGSALVFILIGIALFASLSYVVSQSLRVSTDSSGASIGTKERNTTVVTDLMQYLEVLKMRVFEMTSNGVSDSKIDFRNKTYLFPNGDEILANNNAACGGDASCSVFAPSAPNGVTPMTFAAAAVLTKQTSNTIPQNGHGRVGVIDIKGVGTSAPDLVFVIYGVKPDICNLYNEKQGIKTTYNATTTSTSIGENTLSIPDVFTGYTTTNSFGYGATDFEGKKSFCAPAIETGDNKLGIWHVLKIR